MLPRNSQKMKMFYFALHNWTPGGGRKGHIKQGLSMLINSKNDRNKHLPYCCIFFSLTKNLELIPMPVQVDSLYL